MIPVKVRVCVLTRRVFGGAMIPVKVRVCVLMRRVFVGGRIQTVLRAIKQMQTHARRYRRQIEDRLLASQEDSKKVGLLTVGQSVSWSIGQLVGQSVSQSLS